MKLYHDPNSRSVRALVMLEEVGASYEVVPTYLAEAAHQTESYRSLHPLQQLPALVDQTTVVFESVAICMYIADRFPTKQLCPPPDSPERGLYYQWCAFVPGSIEPAFGRAYQERQGGSAIPGTPSIDAVLQVLGGALRASPFLLASGYSTADALVGTTLSLLPTYGVPLSPPLVAYIERLRERPAIQKAWP